MTNHHIRYHQDEGYEVGYNDGFDDAETGRTLRPEALELQDEGYRLGYANGQRYSLGLDIAEPPPAVKRPEDGLIATPAPVRGIGR